MAALALGATSTYYRVVWKPAARAKQLLFGGCLTLLLTKPTLAQLAASSEPLPLQLQVEKSESARVCPSDSWFEARVLAHAPSTGIAGNYSIDLSRTEQRWRARIVRLAADGSALAERVLEDSGPSCEPLAEASALTVAILADSTASTVQLAPPPEPKPEPPRPAPVAAPARGAPALRGFAGAGAGLSSGMIAPLAPLFGVGLGLDTRYLSPGFRLMMTTKQHFDLGPGRVAVQAWVASASVCVHPALSRLSPALCATADAGVLQGSAEGFDEARPSSRPHEAFGLEARGTWYADGYRLSASLGGALPMSRESFSVAGLGTAYVPPALSFQAQLFCEIGIF